MFRSIPALFSLVLFASACSAPGPDAGFAVDAVAAPIEREADLLSEPLDLEAPAWMTVELTLPHGKPVLAGQFCSEHRCAPISNGLATLPVLRNAEVELFLRGPGLAPTVYQVATGDSDQGSHVLQAETEAHLDALAAAFGVERDPSQATVMQQVYDGDIQVLLEGAEGPFYTDWDGNPQPRSTATPPVGGGYVFFNVPSGDHVLEIPGCNEGYLTWGPGGDEAIDLFVDAGDTLLLPALSCQ